VCVAGLRGPTPRTELKFEMSANTISATIHSGLMAEKFGLDRSYVADVERRKRNISLLNLEIIATGFGLSLAQLFSTL
jgi:transcriptional regulator with XRE-family HTH domain